MANFDPPKFESLVEQIADRRFAVGAGTVADAAVVVSGFGGSANRFNVGVASAIVVAASGVPVVLRGGFGQRAVGCDFGVLNVLGIGATRTGDELTEQLKKFGVAFLDEGDVADDFATVLANPLKAQKRFIAVPEVELNELEECAKVVKAQGAHSALVVCAESGAAGLDVAGHTLLYQITADVLKRRRVRSADFGLPDNDPNLLKTAGNEAEVGYLKGLMEGLGTKQNAPADMARAICCATLLQSAAILLVAEKAVSFQHGTELAKDALVTGAAQQKLLDLTK